VRLAFRDVPTTSPFLRRDLVVWMVVLRRVTVVAVLGAAVFKGAAVPGSVDVPAVAAVALAIAVANEAVRLVLGRVRDVRLPFVVNGQVALDTLALATLLHYEGGLTNLGVLFYAPAFFAYGAVLPPVMVGCHVVLAAAELAALGIGEASGLLAHRPSVFYASGAHAQESFVALSVVYVSTVNALGAYVSHHLGRLLGKQEEQSRILASERGVLLARNEREAARVRALLDVAQLVSGSHTVEELLHAVCDTTAALLRVPRVELFLWDTERSCLRLGAARGLAGDPPAGKDVRYPADVPIVARLRAGEVVQFGAAPSHTLVPGRVRTPFRKGFAAPMACRGSFEGALFVGYDDEDPEELTALVQGIARQAALALVNVRTMEQQQEDAEVSRLLLERSKGLSACLDEEALWVLVVRDASEVLGVPWAVATRFDERSGCFTLAGTHGLPDAAVEQLAGTRFRLEDHPHVQEALSAGALVVADDPRARPFGAPPAIGGGSWVGVPLVHGGWVAGFLTAGTNDGRSFTRRQLRLAEGLAHHAAIALQNARMVADLEAADELKSEFVSTMSHELRTPLNVIIGYTEMLREGAVGPVNSGQRDLIDRLDARGRELLELIEATLHVGRLEAGRDTVELAPVGLRELVDALQASTSGLPRLPGVAFEWQTPDVPCNVITDRAKLALVVRNLVSNAFKFTSEGKVEVRLVVRDDTLVIEVEDTGIGIGAEHLPVIFEMFRQVDGSMTRRHGGVGLGLYIVKQFAGRLGGTVGVTSTPGRGSCFTVVLPGIVEAAQREATAA
jgi:signal transduction histidine kinase